MRKIAIIAIEQSQKDADDNQCTTSYRCNLRENKACLYSMGKLTVNVISMDCQFLRFPFPTRVEEKRPKLYEISGKGAENCQIEGKLENCTEYQATNRTVILVT